MTIRGYIRVSDDEQNADLQRDALEAAGCEVLYSDHGISGVKRQRRSLDRLKGELADGDSLVVWKFDRLGRSTIDLLLLFDELKSRNVRFISMTQGIDTGSVEGRIFFGQLALFAEYEREMIRQRTRAGMQAAKKRGEHIGRPRKLSDREIDRVRELVSSTPVHYHQNIAKHYRISMRTLNRISSESNAA